LGHFPSDPNMMMSVKRLANKVRALSREEFAEFLSWLARYVAERMDDRDNQIALDRLNDTTDPLISGNEIRRKLGLRKPSS